MKEKDKDRIGRGLRNLLGGMGTDNDAPKESLVSQLAHTIAQVPIEQIERNPDQPRTEFDVTALKELSDSIKTYGLIQPITVRHLPPNRFQIISGERRWRACKEAGLKEVPAYIRIANDQEMLEMALVENIQREDLNPIEVSITYRRLMEEFGLTQELLGDRVGKGRTTVTNYLRLLKLPAEIQSGLKNNQLTIGHARPLINVSDIALQMSIYREILEKKLSVREVEELVNKYAAAKDKQKKANNASAKLPLAHQQLQDRLTRHFDTKVQLKRQDNGKGQIVIHFNNDDDLNRILDNLEEE